MPKPRAHDVLTLPGDVPWSRWLHPPDGDVESWLGELDEQLAQRAAGVAEDEAQATALWCHMSKALHRFRPEEVSDIVAAQLDAARQSAALEALRALVQLERQHLARTPAQPPALDPGTVRRLLDGLANDRAVTGRALTGEVLETLCSIALELELTERRVGRDPASIVEALADLRGHIASAAQMVRALPNHVAVRSEEGEALNLAVRRCLVRYAGSLEAELTWSGGEAAAPESAAALLWVLQEILHHLHHAVAGWAKVSVRVATDGIAMRVETPSIALSAAGQPDWLLRTTLRLQLAGGSIATAASAGSSYVDVRLP